VRALVKTGRDHRDADRAREREIGERNTRGERMTRERERERERTETEWKESTPNGTYMRHGNALIGLSNGFRVAPYRWDCSRFDKIEFHLESAVSRMYSLLRTRNILS